MHDANHRLLRSVETLRRCDHRRRRAIAHHPDVARSDMRTVTLAIFALFVPPAAICVDWLLAGGTIDFLIQLSPDLSGYPVVLKVFALTLIVLIELSIAIGISHARDRGRQGRRQLFLLAAFGMAIAAIMPFMTFVITAAHPDVKNLLGIGAAMPFATAAFTLTVHGLTLCTGDALRLGLAWLSLQVQCGLIAGRQATSRLRAAHARQAVGRNYREHATAVEQHNVAFSDARMNFGPIESDLLVVLKTLFTEDELRRSGAIQASSQPQPTPPPAPAPAQPPSSTNQTMPDNSNSPPTHATSNIDTDFSAMAAEEEALRAEAEVTV